MKKTTILISGVLLISVLVQAQSQTTVQGTAQGSSQSQVRKGDNTATIASGTQLSAELLMQLDTKKAKPGDEFKLRTINPVMVGGKRVVNKGAFLIGRVSEVTKAEGKRGTSQLKLTFDELRNKDLSIPFSATLEQITQVSSHSQAGSDDLGLMTQGSSSTRSQTSGSGGGLLGGVTNTVGSTVGSVTTTTNNTISGATNVTEQALGRVIASTSGTVGNATSGIGKGTGLIAISSNTSAEAGASSTLSLTGQNVRIEKGAVFMLRTDKSVDVLGRK